jgi:hypothetical protein
MDTYKGEELITLTVTRETARTLYLGCLTTASDYNARAVKAGLSPTGYYGGAGAEAYGRVADSYDAAAKLLAPLVNTLTTS